jgi:branched-subunit amino acid aminotransferase/4-amino-4-deoxychorismate lyase
MTTTWAYLNSRWIPDTELSIGVDDLGFLLGATVTERLRTFRGHVFRVDEHLQRLSHSLDIVGLPANKITEQVGAAMDEFIARNKSQISPDDDWSIVAFVTPGTSSDGPPTVCVHGYPLPFARWASQFDDGVRVAISDVRQIPPQSLPSELKCRSRMHYYLADQRAAAAYPGARAVLLDEDGYVAEATTANVIVFVEKQGLVSPPSEHILFGVSLGVVQELAAKLGIPFIQRPLSVNEFRAADEVMLTSTSICLLPAVQCDGQPIANGQPGPKYRQLLSAWSDMVGIDIADQARRIAARRPVHH